MVTSATDRRRTPRHYAKSVPDNFEFLNISLPAAQQELALIAAPGTTWPPQADPIVAAAESLGGHFLVVSCGEYAAGHPLAGQTAYALFQLVFVAVGNSIQPGSQVYPWKGQLVSFLHSKDSPQDLPLPMVYFIA